LYDEEYHPPFLIALVLCPPVAPFFWKYHVRVTDTHLEFGYSSRLVHDKVDRTRIINVEVIDYIDGLFDFGGWGYRKNLQWETGYIPKNGSGLKLTYKRPPKKNGQVSEDPMVSYFLCDNPQEVYDLLTKTTQKASD